MYRKVCWTFLFMAETTEIKDTSCFDPVFLDLGIEVYTYEYITDLRKKIKTDKKLKKTSVLPHAGSQERALMCCSDFLIYSGLRGVGKSAVLCMGAYPSIEHPAFSGVIFRKEINDAKDTGSISDVSQFFYNDFGKFKSSSQNMTWDFKAGGSLKFGYYSDAYEDFVSRFRGKNVPYIGVDELTQMKFKYLRFLFSNNRNSADLENQIVGTCNPDGDSWLYKFVGGTYIPTKGGSPRRKWLDENGCPILSMDGRELYFWIYGEREDQAYWGETKTEVVEQGRDEMLKLCTPNTRERLERGETTLEQLFVMSCTFLTGYTDENASIDPDEYNRRLAMLSPEERSRDMGGRWIRRGNNSTLIDLDDLEKFYTNSYQSGQKRYVTADISLGGKDTSDPSVFYLWEGFHIVSVETCKLGAESLKAFIEQLLERWNVPEEDFCFDSTGIGGGICERFSDSIQCDSRTRAFDQREIQVGKSKQNISSYENVRAQCIDNYARRIKSGGYSIYTELLYTKFDGKMLIDHFNEEYISIARDYKKDGKFKAIDKKDIINAIGHSPDFMDAKWLREYIELYKEHNDTEVEQTGLYYL